MKITKKQPLRPRGRSDEKRQSTKDAIREAYANDPQKEVQIIPAKKDLVTDAETYPFTSLLVCDGCGKNYRRKVTKTGPVWVCGTFNSMGKAACASKQIPEETLQAVTAEVLGQVDFSEELLRRLIKSILVCNENVLTFRFYDGSEVTRKWKDRSRSQSWTDEMKATARQKALERRNQNA